MLRISPLLAKHGWHSLVIVPNEDGNAIQRLSGNQCEVISMDLHRLRNKKDPRWALAFAATFYGDIHRLRRVIREKRIDLVLIGGLANPQGAIAARLEGVPVVWQIIDSRTPPPLRILLMSLVRRQADGIMFGGQALVDLHLGSRQIDLPITVCPPGVDTSKFIPSTDRRLKTRLCLGIPQQAHVVGMVANLNPQKGIEYFVRAAAIIAREKPETHFLIVGASYQTQEKYMEFIHSEIETAGLTPDMLTLAGDRADVENFYPAMDVKLITSLPRSEGTTTTAMEAMACGVPVVAVDVGAVKEVVLDDVTGNIVPPMDPASIAQATITLLEDDEFRRRMGEEGRRRAMTVFDVKVNLDRYLSIFAKAETHNRIRQAATFVEPKRTPECHIEFRGKELLSCPACKGALRWLRESVSCHLCGRQYPVVDGIPVLLIRDDEQADRDQKEQQADYFDHQVSEEFEITRPHGTPRLHRWLLSQKFVRSISGIKNELSGMTALTVCGGSGMEAEFLARTGAKVLVSDISLGAARRVRERARRSGLPLFPIVADAAHLPFTDSSIDLVYVHDGLHHMMAPLSGLKEMARVARSAVSVTEPARAVATAIAVRLGIAQNFEESGNKVGRLKASEVEKQLREGGFDVVTAQRYAMYYRHEPGPVARLISVPGLFLISTLAWRAGNCLLGPAGNKLTVVALRRA